MPVDKTNVTDAREDISRFVVHITRDHGDEALDEFLGENTFKSARANLLGMLKAARIEARGVHCLHGRKLDGVPPEVREQFKVGCFSEVPLHQIHLLIQPVEGRKVVFKPYGIVFRKEFLIQKGAQPAIYINSYKGNAVHREAADALFELSKADAFHNPSWRLLPLLNAMHEKYDFTWEREWRVVGDLSFGLKDIVCLILPASGDDDFKEALAKGGLPAISPGWTYEQIVGEMARQQRATQEKLSEELKKLKVAKELEGAAAVQAAPNGEQGGPPDAAGGPGSGHAP